MPEMVNPYIAGAPVVETRMFFGREDVFDWIQNSLTGKYADHTLVIHGQRRVGKTSVLKQLGNRLPPKYIPVFFDLQGRTHTTLDHFLWWLAREIVRVLKQEREITFPAPEKEAFTKDIEYFEHRFLPDLRTVLGENALLLTFDEFDNLEESEIKEELAIPLIDYLRRLMGEEGLNFIFSIGSSGRKLENMQASYTQFFKTALYKKISFLSRDQSSGLITRPVEGLLTYSPQAVGRIYDITSGHPYFTQLICHELFSTCQQTGELSIQEKHVEAVLEDVVERGTVNLKFVWDEASDLEKWSLAALAHLEGKADAPALANFLRKQRIRFSETDLTSGLLRLREKDILTKENRFVIYLLKLWLKKNRPIEQVREELTEVNPIANRYIEIGMEFQDGGQFEKAIENFREALAIAPEHVQAQVNIALAYMDQKLYDKAVVEFEKALAMDDEDVSARSGLCEAHLALGDAATARGRAREAALSYQRVLTINAEHLEARQRMAELSRQRAEKALTEGKDEEALSAFAEALKFTPEDGALVARSEKVRAEKNAKVLAGQVARSEKEAGAHNWDKALAALNDALEIAPGDESILKKIKAIQDKKLRERLDAILAKVEAAEKANRWDTAIAALNEYLQLKPDEAAIQKRLADMLEAKHASWLAATLARVDQAVAAQNWDEALTILNEALRLEPGNAEMQAKAVQVGAAQRSAELNLMFERADQAASAGRWDEAINVLNDGLASEPGNETLQAKLAEARKAKREARWQAALRLAESAAQAGKWETATASLQEVLVNEPDNPEFIQKLAEIKRLERESRLGGLETLAQSLLKAEKFEEALAAWEEYLALLPADREKAQAEIEAIKKAQNLASLYAEATEKYAKKNYEKAIDLFKRIVVEDADYKDATDLLAEAVHLRRAGGKAPRAFNRKAWLTGGLAAILILGIGGGLFWLGKNGLFAAPTPTSTATRAVPTVTPTPTLDPELQAALDTIQSEEPLYQTSFDDWDSEDIDPNAALVNGKLVLIGEDENGAYLALSAYPSDSYAVEFKLEDASSSNGVCFYGAGNGVPPGESFRGFTAEFSPGEGLAVLARYVHESGLDERITTASYDKTKSNVVRLVVLGDQITAFINGQLAYTAQNPAGSVVYVSHGFAASNHATCEFDYFKYWDLRDMDPAVKTALATIQSEAPLYQTSFDAWDFGEPVENASIENGKLIVLGGENQSTGVSQTNFQSDRFAIKFETQILESGQGGACLLNIGADDEYSIRSIFWPSGEVEVDHLEVGGYEITIGNGQFDPSNINTTTLIVLNDQISLFVDGELAFTAHDPEGSAVYTNVSYEADSRMTCGFDNYKFWDLSGVDSAVRIALATIQSEEPLYQTSFDSWDAGWNGRAAGVENGKLILSSENQEGATVGIYNLNSDRYAIEYELSVREAGVDGHCVSENSVENRFLSFVFFGNGQTALNKSLSDIAVGSYDETQPNKVTLLILGDQLAASVNGQISYFVFDPEGDVSYANQALSAYYKIVCEIDNYKIWDLSGVDFSAAPSTTTSGPTSSFASILDAIADKAPDYEDDFSNLTSGWPTDRNSTGNEYGYQDGAYFISAKGNNECYGASPPTDQVFSDFVLEMDARFINQGDGMVSILFRDNDTASYGANISPLGWVGFHKNVNGIHIPLLETEIPMSSFQSWDTPKRLTLVARQDRMAIYVNGELIIAQADTSSSQGIFNFAVCSNNPLQALIDNLKIWDITNLSP